MRIEIVIDQLRLYCVDARGRYRLSAALERALRDEASRREHMSWAPDGTTAAPARPIQITAGGRSPEQLGSAAGTAVARAIFPGRSSAQVGHR